MKKYEAQERRDKIEIAVGLLQSVVDKRKVKRVVLLPRSECKQKLRLDFTRYCLLAFWPNANSIRPLNA